VPGFFAPARVDREARGIAGTLNKQSPSAAADELVIAIAVPCWWWCSWRITQENGAI